MTEHLAIDILHRYASGEMQPAELLAADDHLSGCDSCREQLARLSRMPQMLANWTSQLQSGTNEHPAYEELEAFVDGTSKKTNRENMEEHLRLCSHCRVEVAGLQQLKKEISETRASFFDQAKVLWFSPAYSATFRVVSMAAVLAFFALILTLSFRRMDENLTIQLKDAREQNALVQKQLKEKESRLRDLSNQIAQLQPPAESIRDGSSIIGLEANGTVKGAETFPDRYKQMASLALKEQRISIPFWAAELKGNTETLMGESNQEVPFQLISPIGVVVESDRPEFKWKNFAGANEYRVKIYDASFHPVASSGPVAGTSWKPESPLPRGIVYTWVVVATKNGTEVTSPVAPAPEAKFKVLEASRFAEIEQLKDSHSHLLLGLAYADSGMLPEAKQEFQLLRQQNPDSPLAGKLLQSITQPQGN